MSMLTDIRDYGLGKPVPQTKDQAKAWLKALAGSPLAFHLDDDPSEYASFDSPSACRYLAARRDAAFALLGEKGAWKYYDQCLRRVAETPKTAGARSKGSTVDPSWMTDQGIGRELRKMAKDVSPSDLRRAVEAAFSEHQAPHVEQALRGRDPEEITWEVARNRRGANALFVALFTKKNPGELDYTFVRKHIGQVKAGDVIMHRGTLRTLTKANIGHDRLMGRTIWGDSYRAGHEGVMVAVIKHAMPTKKRRNPSTVTYTTRAGYTRTRKVTRPKRTKRAVTAHLRSPTGSRRRTRVLAHAGFQGQVKHIGTLVVSRENRAVVVKGRARHTYKSEGAAKAAYKAIRSAAAAARFTARYRK